MPCHRQGQHVGRGAKHLAKSRLAKPVAQVQAPRDPSAKGLGTLIHRHLAWRRCQRAALACGVASEKRIRNTKQSGKQGNNSIKNVEIDFCKWEVEHIFQTRTY